MIKGFVSNNNAQESLKNLNGQNLPAMFVGYVRQQLLNQLFKH